MKGLCCLAQAKGDLGKAIATTNKNGKEICGVCEVRPSCRDPQKRVFAYRRLDAAACGIAGGTHCKPTAAGIAQYNTNARIGARTGFAEPIEYTNGGGLAPTREEFAGRPYRIPLS
jgi:hypothetical protein